MVVGHFLIISVIKTLFKVLISIVILYTSSKQINLITHVSIPYV